MGIHTVHSSRGAFAATVLAGLVVLALAACGGSGKGVASGSPSPNAAAAPAIETPAPLPSVGSWEPGTDPPAVAAAVGRHFVAQLHDERFEAYRIWSPQATFDLWASDEHRDSGAAVKDVYVDVAPESSWTAGHALAGRGVAVYEGLFGQTGLGRTAALDLLGVSGGKVLHEEVFLDTAGSGRNAQPVSQWPAKPTPADTVAATAKTAKAFLQAVRFGDSGPIGSFMADDLLFYDTAQKRERQGSTAALRWLIGRTFVTFEDQPQNALIAGRGWAVARWTATGGDVATSDVVMPMAVVLETRSGKVVRMTLYYDSATLRLHL